MSADVLVGLSLLIAVFAGVIAAAVNRFTSAKFNAIQAAVLVSLLTPVVGEAVNKSGPVWYCALAIAATLTLFLVSYVSVAYLFAGVQRQISIGQDELDYTLHKSQHPAHQ